MRLVPHPGYFFDVLAKVELHTGRLAEERSFLNVEDSLHARAYGIVALDRF